MPMIYYAETSTIKLINTNDSLHQKIILMRICVSNLPDEVMSFFIVYMFLLGFVLPLVIISTCYFFLIRHLKRNDGKIFKKLIFFIKL